MPEQANSVPGGLSPLVKPAKPGKADLTANAKSISGQGAAFSNDLDQARKQQYDKVHAEAAQGNNRKPGTQGPAPVLKNPLPAAANTQTVGKAVGEATVAGVQLEDSRLSKQDRVDIPGVNNLAGIAISDELEEPGTTLSSANGEALMGEANRNTTPAGHPLASGTDSNTDVKGPDLSPVTTQLNERQRNEPTPFTTRTALPESQPTAQGVDTLNSRGGEVVAQVITAAPVRQLASGVGASKADDGDLAPPVLSVDEGLDLDAGRLSKGPAVDATVLKTPVKNEAILTNAAALAKGRLSVSGESGAAEVTAPGIQVSGTADSQSASRTSAMGLTHPVSGNGIVTQATLAGRFRQLSNEVAAPGAKTLATASQVELTQAVVPGLNGKAPELRTVGDMPAALADESQAVMDSLMGVTDVKQTVHQRIALTEAILSQMAQETSEVVGKVPAADNMLQALSGNKVSAPVVQSGSIATGPIVQAPLNINLMSADADTALAGNVKWMTNEGVKNAVMTVTPHGMGPISVKIGIGGDQMDVSIIASQHSTRDALESMLPRLREQLAVQGHETVKVDVSDGKSEQARSGNGQTFAESRNPAGASPQDNQSNSSHHGEKTEYGHSGDPEVVTDSVMAEDLQRVAARVVGEAGRRPVFDAYV